MSWKTAKNWDIRRAMGLKKDEPAPPQVPTRLVSTWTDTVLRKQGSKSQRGFGGRLVFFNGDSEEGVRVDGNLVVYAFDESEAQYKHTQPTRRYIFPREQFVRHESESKVGPAYSVWLPWDEVGGERKNISLIARFEPHEGPLVIGEQTKHMLPGVEPVQVESPVASDTFGDEVRLAQHSSSADAAKTVRQASASVAPNNAKKRLQSASIPLSSNWQQRLAAQRDNIEPAE